jgi:hypothetical protein
MSTDRVLSGTRCAYHDRSTAVSPEHYRSATSPPEQAHGVHTSFPLEDRLRTPDLENAVSTLACPRHGTKAQILLLKISKSSTHSKSSWSRRCGLTRPSFRTNLSKCILGEMADMPQLAPLATESMSSYYDKYMTYMQLDVETPSAFQHLAASVSFSDEVDDFQNNESIWPRILPPAKGPPTPKVERTEHQFHFVHMETATGKRDQRTESRIRSLAMRKVHAQGRNRPEAQRQTKPTGSFNKGVVFVEDKRFSLTPADNSATSGKLLRHNRRIDSAQIEQYLTGSTTNSCSHHAGYLSCESCGMMELLGNLAGDVEESEVVGDAPSSLFKTAGVRINHRMHDLLHYCASVPFADSENVDGRYRHLRLHGQHMSLAVRQRQACYC